MFFDFNPYKLREIAKAFYTITGIRFIVFDSDYNEVMSYPEKHCPFCELMKSSPETEKHCRESDERSFEQCKKTDGLITYRCHAGLIEAAAPIKEGNKLLGYLMFGQITDKKNKDELKEHISSLCDAYHLDKADVLKKVQGIKAKNSDQIASAAKILETCVSYIILKEMITPRNSKLITLAEKYIEDNIADVSIEKLCAKLSLSRTKLYGLFTAEKQTGVSAYINERRLLMGKHLLKNTDMPVSEIALKVGYQDYNYFSRVYKKTFGRSPLYYRKGK
ncbi:MAG: PocR ligand-binding domain-containing protein [Bacillota bacterium]|nr:PocR ligand-binding domain-containing protein [Bacillota bacterium]